MVEGFAWFGAANEVWLGRIGREEGEVGKGWLDWISGIGYGGWCS